MEKEHIETIIVYTDGSYQKAGCGYGVYFPNKELRNISRKFTKEPLTNQRAELYAIYKALKKICRYFTFNKIQIYSDSEYSIKSLTIWKRKWKENNWISSSKNPVKNTDIIIKIDEILEKHKDKIEFTHVRAHTGKTDKHSLGNEKADKLATTGAKK